MIRDEDINGAKPADEIRALLESAFIDPTEKVDQPPTILTIEERSGTQTFYRRLLTLGNFSCVIGKAKTKKTFLVSMMTAAVLQKVLFRLHGERPEGKRMVLYFDTEQGKYDSHSVVKRIAALSSNSGNSPVFSLDDFRAFHLRPFDPAQRCAIIEEAFRIWGASCCLVIIDGIADLGTAINDEDEATRLSSMLLRLSDEYFCHIITVLHQNKGDNFATGHLGSSIMKKAELVVSCNQTEDKLESRINADYTRGAAGFDEFIMRINMDGMPEMGEACAPRAKKEKARSFDEPDPAETADLQPNTDFTEYKPDDIPF